MAKGIDFGTGNLVVSTKNKDGKIIISSEKNCFFDVGFDFKDTLGIEDYNYIEGEENGQKRIYVCGKDALTLSNLFASKDSSGDRKSNLRRPMAKMVINSKTDKKAIQMLKYMIQGLVGEPAYEGEIAVCSIPANPLNGEFNTVFHENMCLSFIKELGYDVHPINEALAVAYASNPKTKDEDGEVLNMTGISISWGAGGTNGTLVYKSQPTITFSVDKAGDWVDQQASSVTSLTSSEMTVLKEKLSLEGKLDLSEIDYSDENVSALYIYYRNLISTVVKEFKKKFIEEGTSFPHPIEVIVSGGTSKPKGFDKLVEEVIKEVSWPFEIKGVRRAQDQLSSTAIGAMNAAIAKESKK